MMGIRVVVALLLSAGLAAAQPPNKQPTPPSDPKVQAGELVRKAIAKSQAGEHLDAIELYLQAYTLSPQHTLLSNIASEFQSAKKPIEALRYFCMYLEKDPTGTSAPYAQSKAKAIAIDLGQKDVTDATVCKPEPVQPDKDKDKDRDKDKDNNTGNNTVAIRKPPPARDGGKSLRVAGVGIGAAGAVALGLSIYFGIEARRISDDITNHCLNLDPCPAWPDNIRQIQNDGQAAENKQIVLLVAGSAAMIGGTILYVVGRSKNGTERRVAITPVVTPDTVAVGLSGRFW
jgi:hypothetical protein